MLEEITIACPYCGEPLAIGIEPEAPGEALGQRYTEDCQVCCQPMVVVVDAATDPGGDTRVSVWREDE